jgi:sulfate transport system permease protein
MAERRALRVSLRVTALGYLGAILLAPVGMVFYRAFENGLGAFWSSITAPYAIHALWLTLEIAAIAVPLNTCFGVALALAIVRGRFPGSGFVNALVDLPLALSPVVVGLSLLLLYGRQGWLGPSLSRHGIQIAFALPALVLATIFVSLPFVVREVVPILRELGEEQEQAAATLGASPFQIVRRVTIPAIRWGIIYGVVLTAARAIGEFGAVSIVSGHIEGRTETMTLYLEAQYQSFDQQGAYASAVVLALVAIATLVLMTRFKPRKEARR